MVGKQLQLLKEAVPRLSRVAVLSNPSNPLHSPSLREADVAARNLNVRLEGLEARTPADFAAALSAATRASAGALLVLGDPLFFGHRTRIVELAAESRLPLMAGQREFATFRRAATYVDRIFKGAKPADLPVEQPIKFELVINLKTAKTLGLTVPPPLLLRADHIIE